MDLTTLVLEILVAVIYFGNKVLVLFGKKSGWLWGSFAALLGIIYFVRIELYTFAVLQGGLVILMGYGAFPVKWKKPIIEWIIISVIVLSLSILTLIVALGAINVWLFIGSVVIIWGTYSLTHGKTKMGWCSYIVSHLIAAGICYEVHQYIVATFQVLSAIVSIIALVQLSKQPVPS